MGKVQDLSLAISPCFSGGWVAGVAIKNGARSQLTSIVRRQGQSQFRQQLLKAHKGKCAISGNDVEQALEAAHIIPYLGLETNTTSNGLLLRADLHTLFDLNLITTDPQTMKVLVAPKLMQTQCRAFSKKEITLPESENDRPNRTAIEHHYAHREWTK